jgi:hypothetical protein
VVKNKNVLEIKVNTMGGSVTNIIFSVKRFSKKHETHGAINFKIFSAYLVFYDEVNKILFRFVFNMRGHVNFSFRFLKGHKGHKGQKGL